MSLVCEASKKAKHGYTQLGKDATCKWVYSELTCSLHHYPASAIYLHQPLRSGKTCIDHML